MSTRAEYSLLVPLAGGVPVSLARAMLSWVSRKRHNVNSWSMITQQKNLFLLLPRKTSQLLLQRSRISLYLKQQPSGWVETRTLWGITRLTAVPFSRPLLSLPCHSLCSHLWGFPLPQPSSAVTSWGLEVTAFLGSHGMGWLTDTRGLSWSSVPIPLRQLPRGYWTLHLIVLEGEWYWAPQGLSPSRSELNFVPFLVVNQ